MKHVQIHRSFQLAWALASRETQLSGVRLVVVNSSIVKPLYYEKKVRESETVGKKGGGKSEKTSAF
ncbi:MAG: hypothetical protein V2G52_06460 [bacterium JZ-2024 1]